MAIRHIVFRDFIGYWNYGYWGSKPTYINNITKFKNNASAKDTYIAIVSRGLHEKWNKYKKDYKDWIVYEGPRTINKLHCDLDATMTLVVLEKPK